MASLRPRHCSRLGRLCLRCGAHRWGPTVDTGRTAWWRDLELILWGPSPYSPFSYEATVAGRVHYGRTRHGVTPQGHTHSVLGPSQP